MDEKLHGQVDVKLHGQVNVKQHGQVDVKQYGQVDIKQHERKRETEKQSSEGLGSHSVQFKILYCPLQS